MARVHKITLTHTIEDDGTDTRPPLYCEVEADLHVYYTPGDPGVSDGPLEGSYPPEPAQIEWTVKSVKLLDETPADPLERKSIETAAAAWLENADLYDELLEGIESMYDYRDDDYEPF